MTSAERGPALGASRAQRCLPSRRSSRALLGTVLLVTALAFGAIAPRLLSAEFGLLDDGVTVAFARAFGTTLGEGDLGFLFRFEAARGRFRPVYWLYGALEYAIWGPSAVGFFATNAVALVLTALLVSRAVVFATRDALAGLFTAVAYVLSPPVAESYYTLSKPEVPLALLLAASLCGWAGARAASERDPHRARRWLAVSAGALLLAYFTKETAQVLLLVSATWVAASRMLPSLAVCPGAARVDRWYLAANVGCAALFWAARHLSGTTAIAAGADSQHYVPAASVMLENALGHLAWLLRDFPLLAPMLAFLWYRGGDETPRDAWPRALPVVWIGGWTLVMLPWISMLEYYLLPVALGAAMIAGVAMASVTRSLRARERPARIAAWALVALAVLLLPATVGNAVTSGRMQVAVDVANARLVRFLAGSASRGSTVFVNLPGPAEYTVELGMHLALLHDRPDVSVIDGSVRDLRRDEQALVATPVMRAQTSPAIRLAVYESGAERWRDALLGRMGPRARLVYRETERIRLLGVQLQAPICPVLAMADAHRTLFCAPWQPLLDLRTFEYGWEVYHIHAA